MFRFAIVFSVLLAGSANAQVFGSPTMETKDGCQTILSRQITTASNSRHMPGLWATTLDSAPQMDAARRDAILAASAEIDAAQQAIVDAVMAICATAYN